MTFGIQPGILLAIVLSVTFIGLCNSINLNPSLGIVTGLSIGLLVDWLLYKK
jgi:hypothetical protein